MKEFVSKWSNWWILNPKRKQLDDAFEKELNELIEREVALRQPPVMGWLSAEKKPTDEHDVLICTTDNYIGIGWYYDDSKEWAFEVNKNTAIHSGIVAYWMEIPACP